MKSRIGFALLKLSVISPLLAPIIATATYKFPGADTGRPHFLYLGFNFSEESRSIRGRGASNFAFNIPCL